MTDYAVARRNMVEGQLRTNRVTSQALIAALAEMPRERFVPPALRDVAYVDEDLPLGGARFLMEPLALSRLIQAADPRPGDVALDVGAATGYGTAVLARLCDAVVGLEESEDMAREAEETLTELGVENAAIVAGPLATGYAKQAPYDLIVVEGAAEILPESLVEQLAEGGRLAYVHRREGGVGRAELLIKRQGITSSRVLFDAHVPILPGFRAARGFQF